MAQAQPPASAQETWHPPVALPHTPALQPQPQPQPKPQARRDAEVAISSPRPERSLVIHRSKRQVVVIENGRELRRFPVGVGMPGWETPLGRFQVIEMAPDPVWKHPVSGKLYPPGPNNPLGSRWIGFHRDCAGKRGFNGQQHLEVKGCVTAGFHGTPIGRRSARRSPTAACACTRKTCVTSSSWCAWEPWSRSCPERSLRAGNVEFGPSLGSPHARVVRRRRVRPDDQGGGHG